MLNYYLKKKCKCIVIDAESLCAPFGSTRSFNVAILGAATGTGMLGLSAEALLTEIEKKVPAKFIENNKAAFLAGMQIGETYEA